MADREKLEWRLGRPLEVTFDFVNIGDGPAKITWVIYQSLVLKDGEPLPQRPPFNEPLREGYNVGYDQFWCGQELRPGITYPRTVCDGAIIDYYDVVEILHGRKRLYLLGAIQYFDHAGLRQTAFCRKLTYTQYPPKDIEPGRFVVVRDRDYEFTD